MEHQATGKPISLVLPVLTKPDLVQQAVAGILSSQISLSMSSVEPLLVLANAVGVNHIALHISFHQFVSGNTLCLTVFCEVLS